jgi:hypothetical protein
MRWIEASNLLEQSIGAICCLLHFNFRDGSSEASDFFGVLSSQVWSSLPSPEFLLGFFPLPTSPQRKERRHIEICMPVQQM